MTNESESNEGIFQGDGYIVDAQNLPPAASEEDRLKNFRDSIYSVIAKMGKAAEPHFGIGKFAAQEQIDIVRQHFGAFE